MVTRGWQIVCKPFNECIHSLLCSCLLAKYSENENPSGVVMLEAAETRSLLHYARCLTLLLLLGFRLQRTFPFAKCFPPSYFSLFPFVPFSNSQNFASFSPPLVFSIYEQNFQGFKWPVPSYSLSTSDCTSEKIFPIVARQKKGMDAGKIKFFKHLAKAKNMP